jgi:hypothetical protein
LIISSFFCRKGKIKILGFFLFRWIFASSSIQTPPSDCHDK